MLRLVQDRIPVYLLFREQMHLGVRILSVWSAMAILRWSSRDGIYRHLREVREIPQCGLSPFVHGRNRP